MWECNKKRTCGARAVTRNGNQIKLNKFRHNHPHSRLARGPVIIPAVNPVPIMYKDEPLDLNAFDEVNSENANKPTSLRTSVTSSNISISDFYVRYVTGFRGSRKLKVGEFSFTKNKECANKTYWSCARAGMDKCKARVLTYTLKNGEENLVIEYNTIIVCDNLVLHHILFRFYPVAALLSTSFMQQFQSQTLLSSPQFTFKTSQRSGRHLLVVNGVTFFRNRHRNNKQYWKCNQYYKCKCPCIVVIDEINSRMNVKHVHNHDTSSGAAGGGSSRRNSLIPPMLDPSSSALAGSFLNDSLLVGSSSALAAAASFAQTVQSRVFMNKR
nr:uncharacterized protein LOC109403949 [Aedes albopictus]